MKNTNQNEMRIISAALADDIEKYAREHRFLDQIKYSFYEENGEYKIKVILDKEGILQKYLDEMEM